MYVIKYQTQSSYEDHTHATLYYPEGELGSVKRYATKMLSELKGGSVFGRIVILKVRKKRSGGITQKQQSVKYNPKAPYYKHIPKSEKGKWIDV